ncbi:N-acetyltransferase [Ktedonosporobacter rubrisoli]|uniref:N-acetyltransferase n=2 Tax=Ktedonosporobacter rubrisoli TaxID=2509675 RepID=A0A4P6K806_KTERU|nr:N-acetyltransferase [Ktedonosporobacter rubrisoli]
MLIRNIQQEDAEQFLQLRQQLDQETTYMLLEPGERETTLPQQREQIAQILTRGRQMIFVAEEAGKLIGYLEASGGNFKRNTHTAYIVIGILQAYTGQGFGTRLFEVLESWSRLNNFHRLELTVMVHNQAALTLYKKCGFEIEGIRKHALRVKNAYVDEYYMARLL